MNRKGFTLVELLAVIVLLGVISLIVVPTVTKSIKDNKTELYNKQIDIILTSAREWGVDNKSTLIGLGEKETRNITLEDLKKGGYIDNKIKNPITNEDFPNDLTIVIKRVKNNFEYSIEETNE